MKSPLMAASSMQPVLITVDEFCRCYATSRSRAYELFAEGFIDTCLFGRRRLVLVNSANAFVAANKVTRRER